MGGAIRLGPSFPQILEGQVTDLQLPERAENSEPTAPKCWRDILPIHPAAELWPPMAPDELRALGEDLKANGMQVPISILHHKGYALLDGRNRLDALETVGLDVAALLQAAINWEESQSGSTIATISR